MTGISFLAASMIAASAALAPAQANFAGSWVLDPKQSQGIPDGVEMSMTVKQTGDRVEVETHISSPQGQQTIPDVYVLDGKEIDYKPPVIGSGSGKGKRTSTWTADRSGFEATETATLSGPEGDATITAKRKWTLAADGKTLTVDVTVKGPQGEQTSKRVFTKKG